MVDSKNAIFDLKNPLLTLIDELVHYRATRANFLHDILAAQDKYAQANAS